MAPVTGDHRKERSDWDEPLRRHTDRDPENVEWWTNLPDLVARLEKALADATRAIKELREGRDANRKGIRDSRKLLALAILFNVIIVLFGGYLFDQRDQQRRDDIAKVRAAFYDQCRDINRNASTINAFIDEQINAVRTNPARTPAQRAQIARNFEELRQAVPQCVPPKKELAP